MNNNPIYNGGEPAIEKAENKGLGILGAFIFALAGGVLWFLLYQIGYLAGISGTVAVICSMKGYELFSKKKGSKFGVVMAVACSVIVMVIAWYFCNACDIYEVFKEDGVTYAQSLSAVPAFFEEPEVARAWLINLAMGLGFCVLGAFATVKAALSPQAAPQAAPEAAPGASPAEATSEPEYDGGEEE